MSSGFDSEPQAGSELDRVRLEVTGLGSNPKAAARQATLSFQALRLADGAVAVAYNMNRNLTDGIECSAVHSIPPQLGRPLAMVAVMLIMVGEQVTRAQGMVQFNNRDTVSSIIAPCIDLNGKKIDGAVHPDARAGLYAGPEGTSMSALVLVPPTVGFRAGTLAGFFNVSYEESFRTIPGVPERQIAAIQVRYWFGGFESYEQAEAANAVRGFSQILTIGTGGPGGPTALIGLQAWTVIPEPSGLALLAIGLAALLGFRRLKR